MVEINTLPVEALSEILRHLDGVTLGLCRRVCRYWRDCIDDAGYLWHEMCKNDYKYSSKIAKEKSCDGCSWYHIYRNLKTWERVVFFDRKVKKFYSFTSDDKSHALDINYCVLPLRDSKGVVLYDMNSLKYIPVAIPDKDCLKIVNNKTVTVFLLKSGLLLERSVTDSTYATEMVFKADKFVLKENLYFIDDRDVYKCDLNSQDLSTKKILHCDYDIKELQVSNRIIYLFTDCGKIVTIVNERDVTVKPINCPIEWVKQIKKIRALDDKNFVCYSRNLFKIETNKYQHLYLDFPTITALFFYADIVLIGTKNGEILLYRLSSQTKGSQPIFERLARLPESKVPVQLDIFERISGPMIVASTLFDIYLVEINFFPDELETLPKQHFGPDKILMYKRLLKLKQRVSAAQ